MWETADAVTTQREKKSLYIFFVNLSPGMKRSSWWGEPKAFNFGGGIWRIHNCEAKCQNVNHRLTRSFVLVLVLFAFDYNQKLFGATATEWESSDLAPVFHEITGIMAIIASSSFSSSQKLGKVWARTDGWSGEWKTTISSILHNKTQNHVSKTSNHVLKVKKRLAFSHHEIIMDENWRKIGFHLIFEIQTDKSLKISD